MKKVTGYMTSNGEFFVNEVDAAKKEKEIALANEVRNFADRYGCFSDRETIERVIMENSEELWTILRDFYSEK